MKYYFLSLIFVVLCLSSIAGNDFEPGFVITLKGDTLSGYLLTQSGREASRHCVFRENINAKNVIYAPGEINGYKYTGGKYYVTKTIRVDSLREKTYFFEYLIKGIASIYFLVDDNGEHYYVEKDRVGLVELTEKLETYDGVHVKPSLYKGKLRVVMNDSPGFEKEIAHVKLNHESLISLAKDYHEKVCTSEECIVYEKKNYSAWFGGGVLGGVSINKYDFGGRLTSDYSLCYQAGMYFTVSNFILTDNRFSIKISLIAEKESKHTLAQAKDFIYNYWVSYDGVIYIMNNGDAYLATHELVANFDIYSLRIPIVINFNYEPKNTRYSFGAGVTDKILLHWNKNYKDFEFTKQYGHTFNSFLWGGIVSLGIGRKVNQKHEINCNLTYEYLVDPNAVNKSLRLTENRFSLQLGYSFW